jgi:hypothetical protein
MLQDAFFFLCSAREILLRACDLKMLPPEEEDFFLLQKLYEKSRDMQLAITYVENCLHQRLLGKEETPAPWDMPGESPTDNKS